MDIAARSEDNDGKQSQENEEIIGVDDDDEEDEGIDEEQLEEYREKVLELGRFAVSFPKKKIGRDWLTPLTLHIS